MIPCTEFAIFKVNKDNIEKAISLSEKVIALINKNNVVITDHQIFQKHDNEEELCWQLTWTSIEAVNHIKALWPTLTYTKELESLVAEQVYYAHFVKR